MTVMTRYWVDTWVSTKRCHMLNVMITGHKWTKTFASMSSRVIYAAYRMGQYVYGHHHSFASVGQRLFVMCGVY